MITRLNNCLFGSVKLTKNADLDKYKYSNYSIGFVFRLKCLFIDGSIGKNVIIYGAELINSKQKSLKYNIMYSV